MKCIRTATHWVPMPGGPTDQLMCPQHAREAGRRMIPLDRGSGKTHTCGERVAKLEGQ